MTTEQEEEYAILLATAAVYPFHMKRRKGDVEKAINDAVMTAYALLDDIRTYGR